MLVPTVESEKTTRSVSSSSQENIPKNVQEQLSYENINLRLFIINTSTFQIKLELHFKKLLEGHNTFWRKSKNTETLKLLERSQSFRQSQNEQ